MGIVVLLAVGCARQGLTEVQRRDNLLMPKAGSTAHKEWVEKYGDNADSWEMFTLSFHTKYLAGMDKRLQAVEKKLAQYPDPNKIALWDNGPEWQGVLAPDGKAGISIDGDGHTGFMRRVVADPNDFYIGGRMQNEDGSEYKPLPK